MRKLPSAKAKRDASGLDDLPVEVAVAIENHVQQSPAPVECEKQDATAEELVARLTAIRERIWKLRAMFAVTLSQDAALEADRYLRLFQQLGQELIAKDKGAFDSLVIGHEALLLSPPTTVRQTIPLATQRLVEMRWEAMTRRSSRSAPSTRPADGIHDGMGQFL
ncbi:MAG: hypothetical protein ABSE57_24725 [Bryobacteraceae bacterium]|jgi:hypothetical protein